MLLRRDGLFVFPSHAAGFRGGEGQRWEGGKMRLPRLPVFLTLPLCRPQAWYCLFACFFILLNQLPVKAARVSGVMLAQRVHSADGKVLCKAFNVEI